MYGIGRYVVVSVTETPDSVATGAVAPIVERLGDPIRCGQDERGWYWSSPGKGGAEGQRAR